VSNSTLAVLAVACAMIAIAGNHALYEPDLKKPGKRCLLLGAGAAGSCLSAAAAVLCSFSF